MSDLGELLIGQPEITERLMRALALKGDLPSYLGAELLPTVAVENLLQPEYAYLRRELRLGAGTSTAAVAAQFGWIGLVPKPGTRALAVIEKVIIVNSAAAVNVISFGLTAPAIGISQPVAGTAHLPLDDRAPRTDSFTLNPQFAIASGTNVGGVFPGGLSQMRVDLPAGGILTIDNPGAVLTGKLVKDTGEFVGFYVGSNLANVTMSASFIWRERNILASEQL
jgi:hypothetical protein